MEMSNWIDIAAIVILLISTAIGAGFGAFRAISGLAGTLAGAIGAFKLQGAVIPMVVKILTPIVRSAVESAAETQGVESILESQLTQDLMGLFRQLSEALGLTGSAGEAVAQSAQSAGARIIDAITGGIVAQIAPAVAFLLLFLVIKAAAQLILQLLSIEDLPIISTINKAGGAALGLASGLLIVFILCWGLLRFGADSPVGPIHQRDVLGSRVGSVIGAVVGETE